MSQFKNACFLPEKYRPINLSDTAKYRYDCLIKYKRLREKGFSEKEALEFIKV